MNKGAKITISIITSIVAVILITVLTLGLITIRPLKQFDGYNEVFVMMTFENQWPSDKGGPQDTALEDGLGTIKFSLLRATMEGNLGYGIKQVKKTVTEDGEEKEVPVTLNVDGIKGVRPGSNEFMLMFKYDYLDSDGKINDNIQENSKFVDADGNKIKYNRLLLIFPDADSKIQTVKLYPYLIGNIDNNADDVDETDPETGFIGSVYYEIYSFTAKMYTSKLHESLVDAKVYPGNSPGNV